MQLSIAVGAMTFYPLDTTLAIARDAGARYVELLLTRRMCANGGGRLEERARAAGVTVITAHAVLAFRPQPLAAKIASDVASIETAAKIESCGAIVLHPPSTENGTASDVVRWLDAIAEARERARPILDLAIENPALNWDGLPTQWLESVETLSAVAGEWHIRVCLDLAHAASFGLHLVRTIDSLAPRLANVHLSDANQRRFRGGLLNGLFRDHALPGSGTLPLDDALAALIARDYRGPLTLEFSPASLQAWLPGAPRRRLSTAVGDVRQRLVRLAAEATTPIPHPHRTQ